MAIGINLMGGDIETENRGSKEENKSEIIMLHRNLLLENKKNFYEIKDVESLKELIKEDGLYDNLVVCKSKDDKYLIVSGHRRFLATKMLYEEDGSYEYLPCKIIDVDFENEEEMITKIISANQYRDVSALDSFKTFLNINKIIKGNSAIKNKKDYISGILKISERQAQRYLFIVKNLDEKLLDMILDNNLTLNKAELVSKFDKDEQESISHMDIDEIKSLLNDKKESEKESSLTDVDILFNVSSIQMIEEYIKDTKTIMQNEKVANSNIHADKIHRLIKRIEDDISKLNTEIQKCSDK